MSTEKQKAGRKRTWMAAGARFLILRTVSWVPRGKCGPYLGARPSCIVVSVKSQSNSAAGRPVIASRGLDLETTLGLLLRWRTTVRMRIKGSTARWHISVDPCSTSPSLHFIPAHKTSALYSGTTHISLSFSPACLVVPSPLVTL